VPEAVEVPGEALGAIERWLAAANLRIDTETNLPDWDGSPVDYDAAVSAAGAWSLPDLEAAPEDQPGERRQNQQRGLDVNPTHHGC
jgi:hypothetical protein